MIPIVTPDEMRAIDAEAPEPVDELVRRAGVAVAWKARQMLGGAYGRRVVVLAGKGFNGEDGRVAASVLGRWGVRVTLVDAANAPSELPSADLIIDAAYGTGLGRPYEPPAMGECPVLAVDIASGVNGLTGEIAGRAVRATESITFAALKPGLVLPPGAEHCGPVTVADIGLDVSRATAHLVTEEDARGWLPVRTATAHKWQSACWVIAGSAGMTGAAGLAAAAAARAGSGYVRLSVPGAEVASIDAPVEAVRFPLPAAAWELADTDRFGALVVGPGLGREPATQANIRQLLGAAAQPVVLDADGLAALQGSLGDLRSRSAATVLTPHDGEFRMLTGRLPGPDRLSDARGLAAETGATVLLKGPATVVADPDGAVLVSASGDARLATAGTGDVLAGMIGGCLASGMAPFHAAAAAAWFHGVAATRMPVRGMVASDLLTALPEVLNAPHLG